MLVLGIETSATGVELALGGPGESLFTLASAATTIHQNREVALMTDELFRRAGRALSELEQVVVTTGPGSFTGIRIGISFAQGLSLSLGIPLLPVCSLLADGYLVLPEAERVLTLRDARKGEFFVAELFRSQLRFDPEIEILSLSEVASRATRPNTIVVGRPEELVGAPFPVKRPESGARALLDIFEAVGTGGCLRGGVSLGTVRPLYVRGVRAKTVAERLDEESKRL